MITSRTLTLIVLAGCTHSTGGTTPAVDADASFQNDADAQAYADASVDGAAADSAVDVSDTGGDEAVVDADDGLPACEGEAHSGEATYYAADGTGNCSFPASPDDLMVAAMNTADYDTAAACGSCIRVVGPSGEVTVRIVDRCPGCAVGDVDLSPQAFDEIAARALGRVEISWTAVPCEVSGPIVYFFDSGSNQWWSSVQVRNHRHEIARFEFQDDEGDWIEVERANHNFFIYSAGMGPGPYSFRVTDVFGGSVTDEGIPFEVGDEVAGAEQLPAVCSP